LKNLVNHYRGKIVEELVDSQQEAIAIQKSKEQYKLDKEREKERKALDKIHQKQIAQQNKARK
jgi:hypothetical protein